jgi:hypothetical protein
MKKFISISFFFALLFTSYAFAGTMTLTTYYPPPTAAYNKVNLAKNYTANATTGQASSYCKGNNTPPGTYLDTTSGSPGILSVCTGNGTSTPVNGAIHADSTGALHVVMNGQDVVYPQECYNKFCSYTTGTPAPCANYRNPNPTPQGLCPNGFYQIPVNSSSAYYDTFQTSPTYTVISIVCCSVSMPASTPSGSTGNPPPETSSPPPSSTT